MPASFTHVGLIGKQGDPRVGEALQMLAAFLPARGIRVRLDAATAATFPGHGLTTATRAEIGTSCDVVIIVGGDGTLLGAARSLVDYGVPLLGVNLGRLGFLTDISPDAMLPRLERILAGEYQIEARALLVAAIHHADVETNHATALNDVVIHKWNMARVIEFSTYIDDQFVNTQRSDGMIFATPTGSTAYALSGGGPILQPTLNAIVLVPICPHTLSNRPIVVGGESRIRVVISPNSQGYVQLTCDGQTNFVLKPGDEIHVRRHAATIRLIHPADHDHYQILRAKLRWGA